MLSARLQGVPYLLSDVYVLLARRLSRRAFVGEDGQQLGAGAAQDRHLGARGPPLPHEGGHGARLGERVLHEGADDGALGQARGPGPLVELLDRDAGDLGVPGPRGAVAQIKEFLEQGYCLDIRQ